MSLDEKVALALGVRDLEIMRLVQQLEDLRTELGVLKLARSNPIDLVKVPEGPD
jgi:hypothetical protein